MKKIVVIAFLMQILFSCNNQNAVVPLNFFTVLTTGSYSKTITVNGIDVRENCKSDDKYTFIKIAPYSGELSLNNATLFCDKKLKSDSALIEKGYFFISGDTLFQKMNAEKKFSSFILESFSRTELKFKKSDTSIVFKKTTK